MRLAALGVFLAVALAIFPGQDANALTGTGEIGAPCPVTANEYYISHNIAAKGMVITQAVCQAGDACISGAPPKTLDRIPYAWIPQQDECKNTQEHTFQGPSTVGGCCVYFGPPKEEVKGKTGSSMDLPDALGTSSLFVIINRIITAFLGMVGAFAFAVFIYAGVTWMTAGSSDRVQHAKDTMKYAVIGLAMIALSYAITLFVIGALTRPASVDTTPQPEAQAPVDLE
jgi:hypothetical protein